uniref:Pentatricopeptide repeat-containing protein At1g31790-like n=1 Tax=Nicotiana tabacum TaxID=4097 RepID=A0A1S4CXJ7_TOBAC|nr:PREDICTED: pentatricopeptide repeat-containing protein At1g31790-like [Nicotiana tabacum]
MDGLGLNIPVDIYVSLIKECTESRDPLKAVELYTHICKSDVIPSLPLLNRVLLMLVSCDCFQHARQLFDKMRVRNSKSWAAIIAGCVENDECEEALRLFLAMQSETGNLCKCGDLIDDGILVCVLKACVEMMNLELGKQIHGWLIKVGSCESFALSSFLIKFYGEFGYLESADNVFDHVPHCNTVVWTARIGNLCKEEQFEGAIRIFREMVREGVKKNSFTFSSVLKACGKLRDAGCCGQQVHASSIKVGLDMAGYVQCSLIDMYGKYGLLRDALRVFNAREDKSNIAYWNAMLMGCIHNGFGIEAIKVLYEMKKADDLHDQGIIPEYNAADEVANVSNFPDELVAFQGSTRMICKIKEFVMECNAANTYALANISSFFDELVAFLGSTRLSNARNATLLPVSKIGIQISFTIFDTAKYAVGMIYHDNGSVHKGCC